MCNFFSAIVMKGSLDVLWSEYSDSHTDLIEHFGLTDDGKKDFAKIEFTAPRDKVADIDAYVLRLDEDEYAKPEWWTNEVAAQVTTKCRAIISAAIVRDPKRMVLGGLHIVASASLVVKFGRVFAFGNSTVEAFDNSTVKAFDNSTVEAFGNSTVFAFDNSTVKAFGNSTVEAFGNSTVKAFGNSTVKAFGNSTVKACDCGCHVGTIKDDRKK